MKEQAVIIDPSAEMHYDELGLWFEESYRCKARSQYKTINYKWLAMCSFRTQHICLHLVCLMNLHLQDIDISVTDMSKAMHFLTVQLYTKALCIMKGRKTGKYTLLYLVLSSNLYIILLLLLHRSRKSCSTLKKLYCGADECIFKMDVFWKIKLSPAKEIKCRFIEANNNKELYIGFQVLFISWGL